jgi:stage II sporulation protein AA (anti-sigma F factor antagonist)
MEIEKLIFDDCLIMRLRGELDHHQADQLRAAADQALQDNRLQRLVLNLQGLTFMDSSGVGVILGRYKQLQQKQGQMAICETPRAVAKVLEISGVPRVIPFYKSEVEALRQTARGAAAKRRARQR